MATDPLTDDSRWTVRDPWEWLDYILTWPNPIFEMPPIPECWKASPEAPKWLHDFIQKSWEYCVGLYPIPTERRLQIDGGYASPTVRYYGIDWEELVDLIHDHVGEEADN